MLIHSAKELPLCLFWTTRNDMLTAIHKVSSFLLIALGIVHTALTRVFFQEFSIDALWFAGSGLAMIFVGFLNIVMSGEAGRDRLVRILCYAANLLTLVFGLVLIRLDREPQVILGLLLIAIMTITAFMLTTSQTRRETGRSASG